MGPCVDGMGADTSIHLYISLLEKLVGSMKDPIVRAILESSDGSVKEFEPQNPNYIAVLVSANCRF